MSSTTAAPEFTVNRRAITGVVAPDGTEYDLWCADDGSYWWFGLLGMFGPYGAGVPDAHRAMDEAFDALSNLPSCP